MRDFVAASTIALACVASLTSSVRAEDLAAHARRLVQASIVVDTHLDAPDELSHDFHDVATRGATSHFDLPRAREGGLTAPFFSIYVSAAYADHGAARRALDLIDLTQRVVADHPKDMQLAGSVADVRAAKRAGKLAILMGIEGGHAIEDSLGVLREMYRAGVRYMTLTHVNTNHWADSSGPYYLPDFDPKQSARHGGLTAFGKDVVREMNRIGMIVDISHTSDATVDAVLAVSRAPVMASHSSCRALVPMPRDLADDQIKRIAAKGGIVMINVGSEFLDAKAWSEFVALRDSMKPEWARLLKAKGLGDATHALFAAYGERNKQHPLPKATLAEVADHIEHVIAVAGIDAVGLGTDFDGIANTPAGFEDYSKIPALVEELIKRGHSDADIQKILGENFLAFFARVEAARDALAKEPPITTEYKP